MELSDLNWSRTLTFYKILNQTPPSVPYISTSFTLWLSPFSNFSTQTSNSWWKESHNSRRTSGSLSIAQIPKGLFLRLTNKLG